MTLKDWQQRLSEHFATLRDAKLACETANTVFALEHNLNNEELDEITNLLKEHVRWTGPAQPHWLVWVVYAAEVGYRFAGDQYWPTFSEALPGWRQHPDTDFIKHSFEDFARIYNGARPSGRFAAHFTTICWPITNAILPKDLQRNLAAVLYDVQQSFTPAMMAAPETLGSLLDSNSGRTNSRFRQLSGQHELLGQIASALLLAGAEDTSGLILASTLKRITSDLQEEQKSRDWLGSAKQRASTVAISGARSGSPSGITPSASPVLTRSISDKSRRGAFDPNRITLVVRQYAEGHWSLRALLPNFGLLTRSLPALRQALTSQRAFISGASDAFYPERFLLYGRQEIEFADLPDFSKPLIRLETDVVGFDALLADTCALPLLTNFLFRVNGDGSSSLISSGVVRPGRHYLYLTRKDPNKADGLQGAHSTSISCSALRALYIEVPDKPSSIYRESARSIGLSVSSGLMVHPVGYPTTFWNGDGLGVWNVDDPKMLRITTDFDVEDFTFALHGSDISDVKSVSKPTSRDLILDLGLTVAGEYEFHITAVTDGQPLPTSASLQLTILPKDDSFIDSNLSEAFTVLADPAVPTMEEFWNDAMELQIYGPEGEALAFAIAFYLDLERKTSPSVYHGGVLMLPVSPHHWRNYISKVKSNSSVRGAFDDSLSCSLCFRSVRLGQFELNCEREFVPFRWVRKQKNSGYKLRLIQNDSDDALSLRHYEFATPASALNIAGVPKEGYEVGKTGGLFIAQRGNNVSSILVPSTGMGFGDLATTTSTISTPETSAEILDLCSLVAFWSQAEATGDLISAGKRTAAVLALRSCLIRVLCGQTWFLAEESIQRKNKPLSLLSELLRSADYPTLARSAYERFSQPVVCGHSEQVSLIQTTLRQAAHNGDRFDKVFEQKERDAISLLLPYIGNCDIGASSFSELTEEDVSYWRSNTTLTRLVRFSSFARTVSATSSDIVSMAVTR